MNTGPQMSSVFLGPALHLEIASQPNRHLVCRRQGKELFEPAAPGRLGRLSDQVVPSNGRKLGQRSRKKSQRFSNNSLLWLRLRVKHETGPVMCLHTHISYTYMYMHQRMCIDASTVCICVSSLLHDAYHKYNSHIITTT